jgi:hypothetical protein
MNGERSKNNHARGALLVACLAAWALGAPPALAQDAARALTGNISADPNPYYLGVSEGLTHDSNVYRISSGPSDIYSSTSLFGGFDQPISRQRVFGRATVSLNRYQDETALNNTSYALSAGAALETIENLSGNVNVGVARNLAAPARIFGAPTAVRNIGTTERIDSRVRWGGRSLFTLEGGLGYSRLDYSAPQFVASETRRTNGSLALYYRPGSALRLGVAGRVNRTRSPSALLDPATGTYESNTATGRNVDLLADYVYSSLLSTNARLSYTRQTNSNITGADFSGLTGGIGVRWQPTAKIAVRLDASRDAGVDNTIATRYSAVQVGTGVVLIPVSTFDENNRVTDALALGATYEATAKIGATADLRYSRAKLISALTTSGGAPAESVDVLKRATVGLTYAITRGWGASCTVAYEMRDVTGATVYSYRVNIVGCATQFVWR